MKKSKAALTCLVVVSLTGCGKVTGTDLKSMQTQDMMTVQEVLDFRSEGLNYGNISTRPAIKDYKMSYNEVDDATKKKMNDEFNIIQTEHNKVVSNELDSYLHDYFKCFADDMVLELIPNDTQIKESSGYYYLTVKYNTKTNSAGEFKTEANYLGIDGVIIKDPYDNDIMNSIYLTNATNKVNLYRETLKLPALPVLQANEVYKSTPKVPVPAESLPVENPEDLGRGAEDLDGVTAVGGDGISGGVESTESETIAVIQDEPVTNDGVSLDGNLRKLALDINEFNEIVGSSKQQISYMPRVDMVFAATQPTGSMSGFGMYQEGINGLKEFGFDRNKTTGVLEVTYVFKQNEINGEMDYQFLYVEDFTNNNPFFTESRSKVTVPEFIETQLKTTVDAYDRAVNNKDITSLMDGSLLEDVGLGLRLATYGRSSDIANYISEISSIEGRENNVYLLKLTQTVEDTAAFHGNIAQYRDTYYMVVRQKDLVFRVNDIVLAKRELTKKPIVDADSALKRRLIALNLEGEVTEDVQKEISESVLKKWKDSCTQRELGNTPDSKFGMYTCFTKDRELLSEEKLEYINSKMRTLLTAQGIDVPGDVKIVVTEWVGGYATQVEFMTKEFIDYTGTGKGTYMECYYLVSHYGTEWVIDDLEVINEKLVEGDEYNQCKSQFK